MQSAARLVDWRDSRYQNLALIDMEGSSVTKQDTGAFSLYGDGRVLFSFPDSLGEGVPGGRPVPNNAAVTSLS